MPRVILRTVEPAKLLACQSVEKRCTRMKASRATSDMIFSVNGTIACKPVRRRIIDSRPSATIPPNAVNAARRAAGSGGAQRQRIDQMTGKHRHEQVGHCRPEEAASNDCCAGRLLEPVAEHKRDHHADGGGAFVELSGHGLARQRVSRACRLHLMDAPTVRNRTRR